MKRKTGRVLNVGDLIILGACEWQVQEFKALFGDSVRVTKTRAVKHADDLNFWWAGTRLLSAKRSQQFQRFYDREYDKGIGGKQTYLRTQKNTAAEFARLYNLEG